MTDKPINPRGRMSELLLEVAKLAETAGLSQEKLDELHSALGAAQRAIAHDPMQ